MTSWQQAIKQAGALPDYIYINGERVFDNSLVSIESFDPGTGKRIGAVPTGNAQSINDAVEAAKNALVETLDTGKPCKDVEACVDRTVDYFHYYAGIVDKLEGSSVPLGKNKV